MGIGGRPDRHALSTAVPPTEIVDGLNAFRITDPATVTSTVTFPAGMLVATPVVTSSSCATGSFARRYRAASRAVQRNAGETSGSSTFSPILKTGTATRRDDGVHLFDGLGEVAQVEAAR